MGIKGYPIIRMLEGSKEGALKQGMRGYKEIRI